MNLEITLESLLQFGLTLAPGALAIIATFIVFQIIKIFIYDQLRKYDTKAVVDAFADRIEEIGWMTALATGIYLAGLITPGVSPELEGALRLMFTAIWGYQLVKLIFRFIDYTVETAISRSEGESVSAYKFLGGLAKAGVWIFLILMILSTLGYNVNSLIAGLGVGGVAAALAVQTVLGDLISSLSIVADQPFEIGDFIVVGQHKGTVEKIGVRSTRVRSFDGELLVMANSTLTRETIRNYGNVVLRRAVHHIGVTYDTDRTLLKDIPVFIIDILRSTDNVETSTARANFIEYADSSLKFEIAFEVKAKTYDDFLNIQQEILFKINDKFTEEGIEFAFPTRTVYSK